MPGELFSKVYDEVKRRLKTIKVDTSTHVPYMAGYSKDHKTIYIDSRIPETITIGKYTYNVYKYLTFHELVESVLEDQLHVNFNTAHHEAEWVQIQLMKQDGLDPVPYNRWESSLYPKMLKDFDPKLVAKDLDLLPYIEDKKTDVVDKIKQAHASSSG